MKNPLELLKRMDGRISFVHIKDGSAAGRGFPLGMGEAPVKAVWEAVSALKIPMVIESETCNPDGLTEAEICIKYLKGLENNG